MVEGIISRVSGPVVIASGLEGAQMFDVVRIGDMGLVGEIIRIEGSKATVQVYEDTTGLRPGDKVIPALDQTTKWDFVPLKKKGDDVSPGEIIGEVRETPLIMHKIMVPYNVEGQLSEISEGKYTVNDIVATVQNGTKTD